MRFLSASLAVFALSTGCDSFSLVDQFSSTITAQPTSGPTPTPTPAPTPGPGGLVLGIQTPTLQQNGTTLLVPSGGTPPYTYAILEGSLSYKEMPSANNGSTSDSPPQYTAGTSIGTLTIRVIDNPGNHYDATVTVLPPTPTGFNVVFTSSPKRGNLSWTYSNTAFITGYELLVSTNSGASYSSLATLSSSTTSYVQNGAANTSYYRLYAVSGAYQSLPADAHN